MLDYDGRASHVYGTPVPPDRFDMRCSSDTDARCALTASARREYDAHLIFDENGTFLDAWTNVPLPYSLLMTGDQFLWSASGQTLLSTLPTARVTRWSGALG